MEYVSYRPRSSTLSTGLSRIQQVDVDNYIQLYFVGYKVCNEIKGLDCMTFELMSVKTYAHLSKIYF
jgi:hypothetical protein